MRQPETPGGNVDTLGIDNSQPLSVGADHCIASVVTDDFALGGYVFLSSFLDCNPWYDAPILILHNHESAPLSVANQELLASVSPLVKFVTTGDERFTRWQRTWADVLQTPRRLEAAFLLLNIFNLTDVRRVVCLDADMLCLGDCRELFELPLRFGAVRALDHERDWPRPFFNSGLLVVDEVHLRGVTYHDLLRTADLDSFNTSYGKADQAVLNSYFGPGRVTFLDPAFNVSKRHFPNEVSDIARAVHERPTRILHFLGEKPWMTKTKPSERRYERAEQLWHDALRRYAPGVASKRAANEARRQSCHQTHS